MTEYDRFRAARDLLLTHRTDYGAARAAFRWPTLTTFNWAIDWFDEIARGNDAPALHIVEESGVETKISYAGLSRRSSQVASFLAGLGAKRGDGILLMLGNEVALWQTWLAAIKLGAVVIPTTPMLSGPDLADRLERGHVRWVVTNGTGLALVGALLGKAHADIGCILVGPGGRGAAGAMPDRWIDYGDADRASASFVPAEAAVVPSPDAMRGFVPKAYVNLAAGHAPDAATAQSIFAFLRDTVSPYKMIRRIEFSDLPKTTSGKIRRTELRSDEQGRPGMGPRNDLEFLEERSR